MLLPLPFFFLQVLATLQQALDITHIIHAKVQHPVEVSQRRRMRRLLFLLGRLCLQIRQLLRGELPFLPMLRLFDMVFDFDSGPSRGLRDRGQLRRRLSGNDLRLTSLLSAIRHHRRIDHFHPLLDRQHLFYLLQSRLGISFGEGGGREGHCRGRFQSKLARLFSRRLNVPDGLLESAHFLRQIPRRSLHGIRLRVLHIVAGLFQGLNDLLGARECLHIAG